MLTKNDVCDVVDDIPDLVQHLTNPIQEVTQGIIFAEIYLMY